MIRRLTILVTPFNDVFMDFSTFGRRLKRRFFLFNHNHRAFLHPIYITAGIALALWGAYEAFKYVDLWSSWLIAGGNSSTFCEFNRWNMLIIQPANTWSNFGFLIVGLLLISIGLKDHYYSEREEVNNLLAKHPAFSILIGAAMLWLFFGSFFYHASMTLAFQKMDITGIYAVIIALIFFNAFKAFPLLRINNRLISTHKYLIAAAVLLNILFVVEIWKWNINIVFPILAAFLFAMNFFNMRLKGVQEMYTKYLYSSGLTMVAAGSIWILDRSKAFCVPTSVFQGHALWHLLCAMAVLLLYFYYRSERFDVTAVSAYRNLHS